MNKVDASDYSEFAGRLKQADKAVARNVRKRLRTIAKPLGQVVLEEGSEPMPSRGGLRERLKSSGAVGVSITGSRAALALRARGVRIDALNQGRLRHPLFGLRGHWFEQSVPANTYTDAFERHKADVVKDLGEAVDESLRELL